MSDGIYNEGDLIEAVNGDTVIRARLQRDPSGYKKPLAIFTVAHAPFTRLEPAPVTVQKVIDYLASEGCRFSGWLLEGLREHFGVTS